VDNELEVIRHQMEEKRASLAEKLGVLEEEVLQTVHEATAAVTNTVHDVTEAVDTVKESVHQTVESVKETLDIRGAIREHPWTAVGVSFAAGVAGGMLLEPPSWPASSGAGQYPQSNGYSSESYRSATAGPGSASSLTSSLESAGAEAWQNLKGMALGTLMGVLGKLVTDSVPASMKDDVHRMFEDFNTRLGGRKLYDFNSSEE
jgi:ElaB/YqjD/DUF883 family membrane-anchored ribosome-binding protein